MGEFDPYLGDDNDQLAVQKWMDGLLKEAWENSPMYMHYAMRYVPSMSMVCDTHVADPQEASYTD
eukprot:466423-Rhodomonas_salina.1